MVQSFFFSQEFRPNYFPGSQLHPFAFNAIYTSIMIICLFQPVM